MDHAQALIPADLVATLPRLRRYARVLLGGQDGADELVAETLAHARRSPQVGPDLLTWLFGETRAVFRRKPAPWQPRHADSADADLCARLLRLPLEEREVLLLVAVERLPYADVARLLGAPVATVMSTLARAREHLRDSQYRVSP